MRSWRGIIRLLAGSMVAGFLGLLVCPLQAEDQCQAFLDGLRKREFYDTALDYLETARTDPLADKAFLEVIDYETGVTLVASARLLRLADREKQLDEARNRFRKFVADHPQHPLVISANSQIANLLVERGRARAEQAGQSNRTAEQKKQLLVEARTLFQEAQQMLAKVDVQLSEKNKEYKTVDPNDVKRLAERDQIRIDIMQTRLALASMIYETARTYEPGSKENKEQLEAAAAKFMEYYRKYSRWVGGYYAHIDEARCHKELGNYAKALSILNEVMGQPEDDDGLRRMRSTATELSLQITLLPQVKKYKEAVGIYRNWEKNTSRRNEASNVALAVKCLAGEAALEYARGLKADSQKEIKLRKEYLQLAKDLLTFVARIPGESRQKARLKLADPLLGGTEATSEVVQNFDEARSRGKQAWDRLQVADLKPEEASRLLSDAIQDFHYALTHAPPETTSNDLNVIRYCLAYLYWATDEYYDAAVMGEFLARWYPSRPEGLQGAKIALAAYAKMFSDVASGGNRKFENDRMIRIADFITERWPNSPTADEAWMMLIRAAVTNRDLEKTVGYLKHISTDSPRRGETELMSGQAWWGAYLEAARLPEAERPDKAAMTKMFFQAQTTLENGVRRLRKPVDAGGEVSYPLAAAVLSLAQICLDAGQAEKAVEWLDDPKIGAHTLTKAKNKVTDRGNFRLETFKAALRGYVAVQRLDKAEETMNALEKASGGANLTKIYISLGRQLEDSLKRIRATGNQEEAAKVAHAFTSFLARLSARPVKETSFNTLNWVAEMFMSLAASLEPGNGKLPPEAVGYYEKAAGIFRIILEACRADERYAPRPGAIHSIQIRLAHCLCRMGKYGQDMDMLVEILKVQNNMVDAQREAAYTYQAWGEDKPGYFLFAIKGGRKVEDKDGVVTYLVWGWSGLARRTQSSESHQGVFHEARYNMALCRFKYAMSKSGQERTDLLEQAKTDIMIVYKLYPEMGGKPWYTQYEALLKKIQKNLGEKEAGLVAFEE